MRPDLLADVTAGTRIPEEMPERYLERKVATVEGIGQPITACFFTQMPTDPTNWYSLTTLILIFA